MNTLLRFHYERLRGFCDVCGMLTHGSGACLIQNRGGEPDDGDEDDEEMPEPRHNNQGVVIREIGAGEENGDANEIVPDVEAPSDGSDAEALDDIDPNHNAFEDYADYQEAGGSYSMYRAEMDTNELFNPIPIFENATGDIPGNESYQRYSTIIHLREDIMEQTINNQEAKAANSGKRKREDELTQSSGSDLNKIVIRERGEGSSSGSENNQYRGAVGPKPPHPP